MKKMRNATKFLALFLIVSMVMLSVMSAAGCAKKDSEDKGAVIQMYLASDPSNLNLDPGKLMYSAEEIKFLGLIFQGLTTVDENGKVQPGIAKKWTIYEPKGNDTNYKMVFELRATKWSDGKPVTADDFAYSWKRILEPEFSSPAAPLLYSIKNARAIKEGDKTVDDLGVYADDIRELRIEFDHKIDFNQFLINLASIYLVPVRSDYVDYEPDTWAKKPMTLVSNGPFAIKQMEYNKITSIERSTYYLLPGKKGENIFKYVTPYKLSLDFSQNIKALADAYSSGSSTVFYLGNVPVDKYGEFASKAVVKDLLSTYSYHFNATKAPFDKAEVRKALSIALDRNKIAEIASLGVKPATGIVPHGIIDVKSTDTFREVRGNAIDPAGNMEEAKRLLQSVGVTSGPIEIKVRTSERGDNAEEAVAAYVADVWRQLGFTVTVNPVKGVGFADALFARDYDVIGYDDQAPGVDALSVLAPFAKPFAGGVVTFIDEGKSLTEPYITGFQNNDYDALMEEIMKLDDDIAARTEKLAQAEKMLVDLSPVAPLYFNVNLNITEKISGLSYSKYGYTIFTKASLKNYHDYTTTEAPKEAATAAPAG